jgi:hypothetical protein
MSEIDIIPENKSTKVEFLREVKFCDESNLSDFNKSYSSERVEINEIENKKNSENKKCLKKLTKLFKIPFSARQLGVIVLLCYGNFCVGSAYSLLAPFFPTEVCIY